MYKWFVMLFAAFLCSGCGKAVGELRVEETNDPSTGSSVIATYRGETLIKRTAISSSGLVRFNIYYSEGKMLLMEADTDGDGFCEDVAVFGRRLHNTERFLRQTNWVALPLPTDELLEWRHTMGRALSEGPPDS